MALITINTSQINIHSPHDVTVTFNPPIYLNPNKEYHIYLHSGSLYYSWNTIAAQFHNNKLKFYDGFEWITLTFPDGAYAVNYINNEIFTQLDKMGMTYMGTDSNGLPVKLSPIVFVGNTATQHLEAILKPGWRLDFTGPDALIRDILGFNEQIITANKIAENEANIENGITAIKIHCNLIRNSYNSVGRKTDVLYQQNITAAPGSQILIEPKNIIPLVVNTTQINSIRLYITDQKDAPLVMDGDDINYQLVIEEKPQLADLPLLIADLLKR